MKIIAIQGEVASFHHQAAEALGTGPFRIAAYKSFGEVFAALQNNTVNQAVVAIENSLYGPISEVYDLIEKHAFWITKEHYLHIRQCLVGFPGATPETITDVYSHPVALAQCQSYLDNTMPHAARHEHHDTAGSVADIQQWQDPNKAAIASSFAAAHYGMSVLQNGIETDHHNYTRFILLEKDKPSSVDRVERKTSLLVHLQSQPGALHAILGVFAQYGIDLTLLHSRPIIGKPGVYQFYIDLACNNAQAIPAIAEIEDQGCVVRNLGSYGHVDSLQVLIGQAGLQKP